MADAQSARTLSTKRIKIAVLQLHKLHMWVIMDWQDPDEPQWKRKAVELEYWLLTIFVVGGLVTGIVGGLAHALS